VLRNAEQNKNERIEDQTKIGTLGCGVRCSSALRALAQHSIIPTSAALQSFKFKASLVTAGDPFLLSAWLSASVNAHDAGCR
jgi:hypothetical protein